MLSDNESLPIECPYTQYINSASKSREMNDIRLPELVYSVDNAEVCNINFFTAPAASTIRTNVSSGERSIETGPPPPISELICSTFPSPKCTLRTLFP